MRKGFTLVEMLVVVVVLVTLMSMTFKLTGLGKNQSERTRTIARLQRLENCLSGYYAAFGSYPPVEYHLKPNIYLRCEGGIQYWDEEKTDIWGWYQDTGNHGLDSDGEKRAWQQVRAACGAQPVSCEFPFPEGWDGFVDTISAEVQRMANSDDERDKERFSGCDDKLIARYKQGFDDGTSRNSGRHDLSKSSWNELKLFKFGLMSYLLPRYLVMMNGDENFFRSSARQWNDHNVLPCDPFTGEPYADWIKVRTDANNVDNHKERAKIANIPSQSVCARWLPNLAGICACNHSYKLYGVEIKTSGDWENGVSASSCPTLYSPDPESTSDQYVLDSITVKDGWGREFYYHSPPPYQTYTLWSGGPNGRTFPPWIDRAGMPSDANKCIGVWTHDDIIHMSN